MTTTVKPLKLGIRFDPAALILIYEDEENKKLRRRIIPARNIDILTDLKVYAKTFRMNNKYKKYFEKISEKRLEKVLFLLQDHLKGYSLKESLNKVKRLVDKKDSDNEDDDDDDDDDKDDQDIDDFEDDNEEEEIKKNLNNKKKEQGKIETYNIDDEDFSF